MSTLSERLSSPLEQVSILVSPEFAASAQALLDHSGSRLAASRSLHTDIGALLADRPDVVAECASHLAVKEFGPLILSAGIDVVVISIGALSDDRVRASLQDAATAGRSRIILPSGAIGGVDALAAARLSGIKSVTYTGRKPPMAWRGTAAERLLDLDALREPSVFYEGDARQAAQAYPMNANVAATLALAGIGFEKTRVVLIADPSLSQNVHEFAVSAACGDFTVQLEGRPSAANPKTSLMAGFSIARELLNRAAVLVI